MTAHSSILALRIHGQRGLVGYSPWGHKELDMTEQLIVLLTNFNYWLSIYLFNYLIIDYILF